MTHDELLARINANLCGKDGCDGEHYKKDNLNGEWFALRAVVELCSRDGYTTWDKSMVPMIDGVYDKAEAKKWEIAHGHDIRLSCYREFGCQLLLDPEDIIQAIEKELV